MTQTEHTAVAAAPRGSSKAIRATVSSAVGFTLDFYDLYVAVFVAPVIATLFFPSDNKALSLAGAFGTLAATLLMRPLGAAVMGSVADRHGRRRAMIVALVGVGSITAVTGLLPVEATAGALAPVLLLVLRLVQGLFVGGVFASTLTMAVETVQPRWRGLVSGLVGGGGTTVGSVLAAGSFFLATQLFPGPEFASWGWRAMFFAGGLPVLLSLFLMRYLDESPLWQEQTAARIEHPVRTLFARPYRKVLALNIPIVFGIAANFLLSFGFLPTYLQVVNKLPAPVAGKALVLVNLVTLVFAPLTGHLSQRFGRRRTLAVVTGVNLVVLPVLYWTLTGLHGVAQLGPIMLISGVVSCLTVSAFGPMPVLLNERFPTVIRATGVALSINISFALAGLAPTLINAGSHSVSRLPAFTIGALIIACAATLIGLALTREPDRDMT
jgi:MHS family proline/betaine transporter-like MFS transporter